MYLFVFPSVLPSVCGQNFSETTGWIFLKISQGVYLGQGTTPLNFHDDLDPDPDSGSGSGSGWSGSETTGWIFLKISPGVDLGQGTTPFNFHDDPDPDPDSGSGSFFAHLVTFLKNQCLSWTLNVDFGLLFKQHGNGYHMSQGSGSGSRSGSGFNAFNETISPQPLKCLHQIFGKNRSIGDGIFSEYQTWTRSARVRTQIRINNSDSKVKFWNHRNYVE